MPNPTQSEISRAALPVKKLAEVVAIDPANLRIDQPQSERPRLGKRVLLALALITFCMGVAATLAWQSRGDAAKGDRARVPTAWLVWYRKLLRLSRTLPTYS